MIPIKRHHEPSKGFRFRKANMSLIAMAFVETKTQFEDESVFAKSFLEFFQTASNKKTINLDEFQFDGPLNKFNKDSFAGFRESSTFNVSRQTTWTK